MTSATAHFAAQLSAGEMYGKVGVKDRDVGAWGELLLARDADLGAVRGYEKQANAGAKGALHLLMTMPEYQLT